MPAAARKDSTITITPPTPCQTTTTVQSGVSSVLIGGFPAAVVTSLVTPWQVGVPPVCVTTTGTVIQGSSKVLVNGQPLAYLNANTTAGPITGSCVATVVVGL